MTKSDIIKEECEKFEKTLSRTQEPVYNKNMIDFLIAYGNRMSSATMSAMMVEMEELIEKTENKLLGMDRIDEPNLGDVNAYGTEDTSHNQVIQEYSKILRGALALIKSKGREWNGTEVK